MNEHDNVITAAMLLANIKNAVDDNDYEFLTELAERADDPYISTLLEYCDALADEFIESATLNESADDDGISLAEDMEELLEIFGLRTADKKHLMDYSAAKDNAEKAKSEKEAAAEFEDDESKPKPYRDVSKEHREAAIRQRAAQANANAKSKYDSTMKASGLRVALKDMFSKSGASKEERDAVWEKNHLKDAAKDARRMRRQATTNYLHDRFSKDGAYKTAIRDTKDAVKKDLAAAKYAYKHAKGDQRRQLKRQYRDLKAQNGGLWRNRLLRRQMKADLKAQRDDVKKNSGIVAFKGEGGKTDYAAANLRRANDQAAGKTSAKPLAHTPSGDEFMSGDKKTNMAGTMNVGKSKNAEAIAKDLPKGLNPASPIQDESYDFYAYSLLESNGWIPSADNKDALMSEGALIIDGSRAMLNGTDGFILAELLDLNGFEVTESNIEVLAEALDSGSAMIDFHKI
jgi:hypothetical protein